MHQNQLKVSVRNALHRTRLQCIKNILHSDEFAASENPTLILHDQQETHEQSSWKANSMNYKAACLAVNGDGTWKARCHTLQVGVCIFIEDESGKSRRQNRMQCLYSIKSVTP
ncbi:hypothetical protein CEXT_384041 [Caerostris extrusa]|uniref:LAGLIDADG homing endonuclease n=1 Tax=Caerostris extrusa TaxID=172846 RepID=A0AAV4YAT6_CAEEX|nr:hypothetical protein CEXT_384041 [Caerostris extrusa]